MNLTKYIKKVEKCPFKNSKMENGIPDWLEDESILLIPDDFVANNEDDLSALPKEYEEQLLVSDLLYCLVGTTGTYFKLDKENKLYLSCRIRNNLNKSFINSLLPLCDDISFIKKYAETHFSLDYGRVLHAFCASLKNVISDFTQLVAKIESFQQVTLPILTSNLRNHFEPIHSISELIEEIGFKKGCNALSVIHNYLNNKCQSNATRKIVFYLFQTASEPLLNYLEKWIYSGVVDDPFEEFFIFVNESISPEYDDQGIFWQKRFEINEEQIPAFLSQESIPKILASGKAKAVLNICGEKLEKSTGLSIQSLIRGTILDSTVFSSSFQLMNVLRTKYELVDYFQMFFSVYLCARGSWLSLFFKSAKTIMKPLKTKIHLPTLDVPLSMSLPETMQGVFYTDIGKNIFSEKLKKNVIELGSKTKNRASYAASSSNWDYFNIKSRIDWPLILIFTEKIQNRYQLLFRNIMLWRRLEYKLGKLWGISQNIKEIDNSRHTILLFTRGYLDYISLCVINPQWTQMIEKVKTIRNIEELFRIHDDCLSKAFNGLFLTEPRLFNIMSCLLFYGFQYTKEMKKWINSVKNEVTSKRVKKQLARPILKLFEAFQSKVQSLIVRLTELGKNDSVYSDFILWIDHK